MATIGLGGSWSSFGCSGQNCLNISNSSLGTSVSLCFTSPPAAGTYVLVSSSGALAGTTGKACLTITNPTSQPTGTTWYSSGGNVTVTVSGSGAVTATFNNIACLQGGSAFPTVTVTGQVGCL